MRSGRVTMVVGSGFPGLTPVTITIDESIPPVSATTAEDGTFRAPIVVPRGIPVGTRRIVARARNRTAAVGFLVVRPTSDVPVIVEGRRRPGE